MVRHIVSWNFKPELTEQQRKELAVQVVEQLNALQGQIPGLVHIQAHCPPWTAATATWCSTLRSPARKICLPTRTTPPTRQCSP